jgi:hypothetical protein
MMEVYREQFEDGRRRTKNRGVDDCGSGAANRIQNVWHCPEGGHSDRICTKTDFLLWKNCGTLLKYFMNAQQIFLAQSHVWL